MPLNILKQDLRSRKTKKALNDAISVLLESQNFKKITIKDICNEAAISRATFYAHFMDKYDLLKYWLTNMELICANKGDAYEVWSITIRQFVNQNKKIIKNIMDDADNETLHIVHESILRLLCLEQDDNDSLKHITYSNILAGGIVYYLSWHVRNNFPSDVMNVYLYKLITEISKWVSE